MGWHGGSNICVRFIEPCFVAVVVYLARHVALRF